MEMTEGKINNPCGTFVRRKKFQTFSICAALLTLGAAASVLGPTLIDLRKQVDASVETVTYTISGRSAGFLLGGICGGVIYDHTNHHLFLSFGMIVTCVTAVAIPFTKHVSELAACLVLQGIAMGCSDSCGNAMILGLWRKKSGPYMQALHFSYAVGAFVSPIIAQPLLSQSIDVLVSNASGFTDPDENGLQHAEDTVIVNISSFRGHVAVSGAMDNTTYYPDEITRSPVKNIVRIWTDSHIMFAYIAIGIMALLCAAKFFITSLHEGKCFYQKKQNAVISNDVHETRKDSMWFKVPFMILLALYFLLYVGLEVSVGSLVTTFGFDTLRWPKHKAAHLSTVFWGSLATSRGLSIVLSKFLSSTVMIIIDLCLIVLSTVLMSFLSNKYDIVMWICTAVYGLGMASVSPAGISWAERYVHISGKTASALSVGSGTGAFVLPALFGHFFQINGMYFVYMCLGGAVGSAILFAIVYVLARCHGERYLPVSQDERDQRDNAKTTKL